jgi:hypothetical protein
MYFKVRNKISRSKMLHSNWIKIYNILEANIFVKPHREFRKALLLNVKNLFFISVNLVAPMISILSSCLILST